MKSIFIITTLMLSVFSSVEAQVTIKPGVKAGLNLTRFTNTESDFRPDFYVGGLVEIKFKKFYTLQPELLYSRQGATITYLDNFGTNPKTFEKDFNVDYLSLGVINKFTFGQGFQVAVGPSLDFLIADNFDSFQEEKLIGFDLGLNLGVGYSLPNGLTFEARIKQGLLDIFGTNYDEYNDENGNGNYDEVILNQLFQLGVSYTFGSK
ncbi:porin family protein [Flavobacterium sp. SM2513]|uniref:porin family protein n=1 Tax=Flavobacterium sp. SM2513 TaxID=3424766 RepID=UPI003D7FD27B